MGEKTKNKKNHKSTDKTDPILSLESREEPEPQHRPAETRHSVLPSWCEIKEAELTAETFPTFSSNDPNSHSISGGNIRNNDKGHLPFIAKVVSREGWGGWLNTSSHPVMMTLLNPIPEYQWRLSGKPKLLLKLVDSFILLGTIFFFNQNIS